MYDLLNIKSKGSRESALSIIEGDFYIRFIIKPFNSLFFVYEIGSVFPKDIWRHLIGSKNGFDFLLNKSTSYLPAYSLSLDRPTTLIYWGEAKPFLSVQKLKDLGLSNIVLKADDPSSVEVSVTNLTWPKSAQLYKDDNLEQILPLYLFNSLMPPILSGEGEFWFESPFVIVGDRILNLITVHKTICNVDKDVNKLRETNGMVTVQSKVMDRNFDAKSVLIDMPEKSFDKLNDREPPYEVVFVKNIALQADPSTGKYRHKIRYTIYPFDSIQLFKENYGWLLTAASITLREFYLATNHPLSFSTTTSDFKLKLTRINRSLFYGNTKNNLAATQIESQSGIQTLATLLGVYIPNDNQTILYLHPALIEPLLTITKNNFTKDNLVKFEKVVSDYYTYYCQNPMQQQSAQKKAFKLQELFEKEFGSILKLSEALRLSGTLDKLLNTCVPLSKALSRYPIEDTLFGARMT